MHDLFAMYKKTREILQICFQEDVNKAGNFRFYPVAPKMCDLDVLAVAIIAESTCIQSENWLFSKLRSDYQSHFPQLIDRTRFNRRRRFLAPYFDEYTKRLSCSLSAESDVHLVDSMPCPIVKNSRERSFSICKEDQSSPPKKGYSAVDQRYYIGYKFHLLTCEKGVIQDYQITPANVHDIQFLKQYHPDVFGKGKTLVADKGYISVPVQQDLFDRCEISLKVPYRSNQKIKKPLDPELGKKRRRIESVFSQFTDQFNLKQTYVKTFLGFASRLKTKIAAWVTLQWLNWEKGRPLNQIKHAWC